MSGSIKWMVYTYDAGDAATVRKDESNGEAGGFGDVTDALAGIGAIEKGCKMRGVNLISATGQRRFLEIGAPDNAIYAGTQSSITIDTVEYQVTSLRGEKRVRAFAFDTGLNDGDAT